MLRARNQGDDPATFRWARTEMKRELAMSTSTYAKIAGIQSEIGRVVVTRVAGNELEYKRRLNMYHRDMTCNVNNIRREQIKMRRKMGRYVKKMRQTRIDHAKMIKEQERHDRERAELEELHLRLKFEAAATTPEPEIKTDAKNDEELFQDENGGILSPSAISLEGDAIYIQTGAIKHRHCESEKTTDEHVDKSKGNVKQRARKESKVFSPILPMIDEDSEKEIECNKTELDYLADPLNASLDATVLDEEEFRVNKKRKRKKGVSFSDIMKLKYSGTKHLFDLVNILAKKHGIPDEVEKVPDPRDHIVHRGSTNGSLRLEAAILYPMKYGYIQDGSNDVKNLNTFFGDVDAVHSKENCINSIEFPHAAVFESKSQELFVNDTEFPKVDKDNTKRFRKLSLDERRAIFMSGSHSPSVESFPSHNLLSPERLECPTRKLSLRDRSMPELVEKVAQIKLKQMERQTSGRQVVDRDHMSPHKPSSSHSTRSLDTMLKHTSKNEETVSWTQAFGILRNIHSLEDIVT